MNIYQEWGFEDSPFQTTALPASKLGDSLLVGRDKELQSLLRRIYNPPKIVTVEGLNGVGKTSLVNVAAYQAYKKHLEDWNNPLLIPCNRTFQLRPDHVAQDFIDEVLMAVAQTLIDRANDLSEKVKTGAMDKWLNSPQLQTIQGSISILGNGGGAGKGNEINTSSGFQRSGFRKEILRWLLELFPSPQSGGVICTIDNLELLQTSEMARKLLEQLRDELLVVPGLRWVLCGALGIVLGTASSPRLEGFLHTPIEIGGVDEALATEILYSRIKTFAGERQQPYLPILPQDFENLYDILNKNLRSVLGRTDSYCQWVADRDLPKDKDLEDAGLLVSTQDEGDKRRKTIQATPKGWLVNYSLSKQSTQLTSISPDQVTDY